MQKQIQVEKTLSFEEINPTFSQLLAENGGFIETKKLKFQSEDGKVRDLMECKSCIVAEAHGN